MAASLTVDDMCARLRRASGSATQDFRALHRVQAHRGGYRHSAEQRAQAQISDARFVTPDDVKQVALPVLRHRITPSPEMEIEGRDIDELLRDLFEQVEAPRA
jgi:MoxR-like ATPase